MNVSFELVIPPVIVGILMTMVVNLNKLIMESTVENQVTYQLQIAANNSVLVIEDQVKDIHQFLSVSDSAISFVNSQWDTVSLRKNQDYLTIETARAGVDTVETNDLYLKLNKLEFDTTSVGLDNTTLLDINVETINSTSEKTAADQQYYAFARRKLFLRNMKFADANIPGETEVEEVVDEDEDNSLWRKLRDWFSFW